MAHEMEAKRRERAGRRRWLQSLNALHLLVGVAVAAAGASQLTDWRLGNSLTADFRWLGAVFVLAGALGCDVVRSSRGGVAATATYALSALVALFLIAVHVDTGITEVRRFIDLDELARLPGGVADGFDRKRDQQIPKVAVCAAVVLLATVEFCLAVASTLTLAVLSTSERDNVTINQRWHFGKHRGRLVLFAVLKLFFGLAAVIMGVFVEYLQRRTQQYVRFGVQVLVGGSVVVSAFADLRAIYARAQSIFRLKVSVALSVVVASLTYISFDYWTLVGLSARIGDYRRAQLAGTEGNLQELIADVCLMGCLGSSFFICAFCASETHQSMEQSFTQPGKKEKVFTDKTKNRKCFGIANLLLAALMAALALFSLISNLLFSSGYTGVDLLGPVLLLTAAALFCAMKTRRATVGALALSLVACGLSVERLLLALHQIALTLDSSRLGGRSDAAATGALVLFSAHSALLALAALNALVASFYYGARLHSLDAAAAAAAGNSTGAGCVKCLSFFHLVAAATATAALTLAEMSRWKGGGALPIPAFVYRSGAGVFAATFLATVASAGQAHLQSAVLCLHIACASLALFLLSPASSAMNLAAYAYDQALMSADLSATEGGITSASLLTYLLAAAALLCAFLLELLAAAFAGLRLSNLVQRDNSRRRRYVEKWRQSATLPSKQHLRGRPLPIHYTSWPRDDAHPSYFYMQANGARAARPHYSFFQPKQAHSNYPGYGYI